MLDVIELVAHAPWRIIQPTEAVLFRKIERDSPTLLIDEADTIFGERGGEREALRAILNEGHRRGALVPRVVTTAKDVRLQDFSVFGPKIVAGIGRLPPTVEDRAIPVELRRKAPDAEVMRFRAANAELEAISIREALGEFRRVDELPSCPASANGSILPEINDRAEDSWEILLRVGLFAGPIWFERARRAAIVLHSGVEEEQSLGIRMLVDVRRAFEGLPDITGSSELIEALRSDEFSPWQDYAQGKGLSARTLANVLRPHGIRPRTVRVDATTTLKGYRREDFEEAWACYLPRSGDTET